MPQPLPDDLNDMPPLEPLPDDAPENPDGAELFDPEEMDEEELRRFQEKFGGDVVLTPLSEDQS